MTMDTIRRLAADILGVGRKRIWISPEGLEDTRKLATRADVRGLIDKGVVKKLPVSGRKKKEKAKRSFKGSRKGNIAKNGKTLWMEKVRSQRKLLVKLVSESVLKKEDKREIYYKIKSGLFRSKKALVAYLKENKFISLDYQFESKKPKDSKNEINTAKMTKKSEVSKKKVNSNDKS